MEQRETFKQSTWKPSFDKFILQKPHVAQLLLFMAVWMIPKSLIVNDEELAIGLNLL